MKGWDRADTLFLLMLLVVAAVATWGGEALHLDPAIFTVDGG